MSKIDLLIHNSSKLITLAGSDRPRVGKEMGDLAVIENGAVAVNKGKIVETGSSYELLKKYSDAKEIIDANDKLVMPGFVDCHTHLVFGGSRDYELGMKLAGATYIDILKAGGGIHSTVEATRKATKSELTRIAKERLDTIVQHGTTTIELKTGYGLDYDTEKKLLEVAKNLSDETDVEIVSTFLGAHTIPKGIDRNDYINWIVEEAIPEFKNLAEFCDIFTEDGAFTYDETERILSTAKDYGYKLKIHAGQFNDLKAAGLAAELGAYSADHLEAVSKDQLDTMKMHNTVAVLMPGVNFFLMANDYADAREMISNGNPVALATDFNPGSSPSFSMQMMIALGCYQLKMSPEEVITASTINAAHTIDRATVAGSLEPGKRADILIMKIKKPAEIPYYFGGNLVEDVILAGKKYFKK
ncbi:MAG TPA: imidazolonepropionase [Victivallales bacterium]|nr:imidazolonepropionase [Victivallales bacterium]